jgi:hypothetical protein
MCATLGVLLGASTGLIFGPLAILGVVIGLIAGATAGAVCFPRPKILYMPPTDDEAWDVIGPPLNYWRARNDRGEWLIVLMQHHVYVAHEAGKISYMTKNRLESGEDPMIAGAATVRLDAIESLEIIAPGGTLVALNYHVADAELGPDSQRRRLIFGFRSCDSRDAFLTSLETYLGRPMEHAPRNVSLTQNLAGPLASILLLAVITLGCWSLAELWRVNPPRDPTGAFISAGYVRPFLAIGPEGFALAGAVPIFLAIAWFALRCFAPLQIHRIEFCYPTTKGRASRAANNPSSTP